MYTVPDLHELTAACNEAIAKEYQLFSLADPPQLLPGTIRAILPVLYGKLRKADAERLQTPKVFLTDTERAQRIRNLDRGRATQAANRDVEQAAAQPAPIPPDQPLSNPQPQAAASAQEEAPATPSQAKRPGNTKGRVMPPEERQRRSENMKRVLAQKRAAQNDSRDIEPDPLPPAPAIPGRPLGPIDLPRSQPPAAFNDSEVRTALADLATYGYLPTAEEWNAGKPDHLPTMYDLLNALHLPSTISLAKWAGLKYAPPPQRERLLQEAANGHEPVTA